MYQHTGKPRDREWTPIDGLLFNINGDKRGTDIGYELEEVCLGRPHALR